MIAVERIWVGVRNGLFSVFQEHTVFLYRLFTTLSVSKETIDEPIESHAFSWKWWKYTFISRKVSFHTPYLHDPLTFACLSALPGIERIVVTMCDSWCCCTSAIYTPYSASRRGLDKLLYSTGTFKSYSFSTKCVDNRGREFRNRKFNSGELWFDLFSVINEPTCNNYKITLNLI